MRQIDIINFVDAVTNPSVHFKTLKNILPVFNSRGSIIMFAGNQSVVFRISIDDKYYSLKCSEVPYEEISEEVKGAVKFIASMERDYLVRSQHIERELSIYTQDRSFIDLSVELRPWIEGTTLGSAMTDLLYVDDSEGMDVVIDKFLTIADNLLMEDFAHGDLKPDNILITNSGKMLLIDFGSAYINQYHSSPSKEIGTIGYRHPLRDQNYYNLRIDDYPIAVILSTMLVASKSAMLFDRYNNGEFSIFNPIDVIEGKSEVFDLCVTLFKDDIIESHILNMLKSPTPALEMVSWWLKRLIEKRAISSTAVGDELMFDDASLKYGICTSDKTTTFPAIFDDATPVFSGHFAVKVGSTWAVVDRAAKPLTDFIYRDVKSLDEGRVAVMQGRKYAIMNSDYTMVTDYIYDDINNFHSCYAVVKRGGKYGYINAFGVEVVDIKYDFAKNIKDGIASVRSDDKHINISIEEFSTAIL